MWRVASVGVMAGAGLSGGGDEEVQVVLVADSSAEDVSAVGQLDVGARRPEHDRTFLSQEGMHAPKAGMTALVRSVLG